MILIQGKTKLPKRLTYVINFWLILFCKSLSCLQTYKLQTERKKQTNNQKKKKKKKQKNKKKKKKKPINLSNK